MAHGRLFKLAGAIMQTRMHWPDSGLLHAQKRMMDPSQDFVGPVHNINHVVITIDDWTTPSRSSSSRAPCSPRSWRLGSYGIEPHGSL